jgi:acyl-CoA thioester hydrolase
MEGYKFKLPLQIRYSDFDMLNHMNSAQYATLIELGRIKYFMHINWDLEDVSNVVASFKIDYITQIVPSDEVEVWIRVAKLGTKSFLMEYTMASPKSEKVYAKAETTQVCILKKDNSSTPIPANIRNSIIKFENL